MTSHLNCAGARNGSSLSISIDDSGMDLFDNSLESSAASPSLVRGASDESIGSNQRTLSIPMDDVPTDLFDDSCEHIIPRFLDFSDIMNESLEDMSIIAGDDAAELQDDNEHMEEDSLSEQSTSSDFHSSHSSTDSEEHELPNLDALELEDMFHGDVNHFPAPIVSGKQGTLLHLVSCSFDVDSIYFMGPSPSQVLEFMGTDGNCKFQSAVNRICSTNSSRIAVDYHGVEHLMPNVRGRKLKRLKVLSLHHFPNIQLGEVSKGDVKFFLTLHVLQPQVLTGCNYMTEQLLLPLICALNIAIDGKFPYDATDEDYGMQMERLHEHEWSTLPFFELQDGSKKQRKIIHNCHKQLSMKAATAFFFRFEVALELMATAPDRIDAEQQQEDVNAYWRRRQGIEFGGSGECLTLQQLSQHASSLVKKTITMATAAGTKKTYCFPNMDAKWVGTKEAVDQNGEVGNGVVDEETLYPKFSSFRRQQLSNIKEGLETSFPGMLPDHPLFDKVHSFFDVGLEMRPIHDNMLLLANLQRSKLTLSGIRAMAIPDEGDLTVGSVDSALQAALDEDILSVGSVDSVVSDDDDSEENVAPSDFVDRFLEVKALSPLTSYKQHFTRTMGNTHTGHVRMNAVQDNTADYDKVVLAHPTAGFFPGGQIYEPYIRMESMKQQRPQSSKILSIIPHFINLCRRGGHLMGTTITESIAVVSEEMKFLSYIYQHRRMRRNNARSNVLRLEVYVAFKNGDLVVGFLPHFDPTHCAELFNKKHVDAFEENIVQSHFVPCQKLLGNLGALLQEGRQVELEKLSPRLRTRICGSLEISALYVEGNYAQNFIILRNILREADDAGITIDLPISVQVNLSEVEKAQSGFDYGLPPQLLPLIDGQYGPTTSLLRDMRMEDLSSKSKFPPYFSTMDRSVVRSLNMGMNVGKLERAKAQVSAIIHHYSRQLQENDNVGNDNVGNTGVMDENDTVGNDNVGNPGVMDENDTVGNDNAGNLGVMDDIDYDLLMAMPRDDRLGLLKDLARLFVICYCHTTWELCIKGNVFGDNPDDVIHDAGHLVDPRAFENFPFVEREVTLISDQLPGETRFVRKEDVTSTGKWERIWFVEDWGLHCSLHLYSHISYMIGFYIQMFL